MKLIAVHGRVARTLAVAALTTLAAVPALARPALAQSTQAQSTQAQSTQAQSTQAQSTQAPAPGRCTLLITSTHPQIRFSERIVNICTPRAATDRLTQTRYYGADWPDPDDWLKMFDRVAPPLTDNFVVSKFDLNEDARTGDEIYTRNLFFRADGSSYEIRSNEVHKQFHPTYPFQPA
ncbi:hypothetical protein [Planomonospora venezuelensis]|uniref:Secreted protein n=1 Tax=Planomonospora venezuelensis TaxID=1999 RepID=A0A841CYL1_PLAVE|nr:hypothetical protein [Planomonospora venezuelensis]MBB5962389.1 hypothetical protein [Planomonospora venezuelensis]GIN00771.1 hypothetical protein Pve01_24290 [Planomonospora venezuelensis]